MSEEKKKKAKKKFPRKNIIALLIFFGVPFFAYRSCTSGYTDYSYYVHAKDEAVFAAVLKSTDARIIKHGRKLRAEVLSLDSEIDNSDGPDHGKLRWYGCSGIDCDEGWEGSFVPRK